MLVKLTNQICYHSLMSHSINPLIYCKYYKGSIYSLGDYQTVIGLMGSRSLIVGGFTSVGIYFNDEVVTSSSLK